MMNRPRGRKDIPKVLISFGRHLVYAEGTKTEPLYVEDLRAYVSKELGVSEEDIEIVPVRTKQTRHTVDLVKYAINDIKERRENHQNVDYVWIFYDKDSFDDFDEAYSLIKAQDKADKDAEWNACWSNECFEVWVYHYFENLTTPIARNQYIKKINSFLKSHGCEEKYTKNMEGLHSFLTKNGGNIRKAVQLMKKKDVDSDIKPNPSSGIYQFAEFLLAYIDEKAKKPT